MSYLLVLIAGIGLGAYIGWELKPKTKSVNLHITLDAQDMIDVINAENETDELLKKALK